MFKRMSSQQGGIVKISLFIVLVIAAVILVILIHAHKSSGSTETSGVPINQSTPSGGSTAPDRVDQSNGTNDQVPSATGAGPGSSKSLLGPGH